MTATAQKQINWLFPSKSQTVTKEDFRQMVRNAEKAPHITLEEFYNVTDKWLEIYEVIIP
ncbi:MAG: hypothetical protein LBN27_08860 [Prevotellaceae bacterium]|jgi:hypothetical protein|nr:hypothetical protein [Prevotellaceae bacterium]